MGIRIGRLSGALLLAGALVTTVPAPAAAVSTTLWTLTATPLAVTTGVATTFTLTATNEDPLAEIGCIMLDVPSNFIVAGATATGSSADGSWDAALLGNRVKVRAESGDDRLGLLDWVSFTVNATAQAVGSLTWNATAYPQQDCGGSGALLGVPPIVVVTGPTVTPTPTPTPTPTATSTPKPTPTATSTPKPTPTATSTPKPTPKPTPTPTPHPSLPSLAILPTPTPTSTPHPTPTASVTPESAAPDSTDAAPEASGSDGGAAPTLSAGPGLGLAGDRALNGPFAIAVDSARLDVGTVSGDVLSGQVELFVPAAVIAGPGVLLLLLVALQAAGAMAWVPAVRRLRGEDSPAG